MFDAIGCGALGLVVGRLWVLSLRCRRTWLPFHPGAVLRRSTHAKGFRKTVGAWMVITLSLWGMAVWLAGWSWASHNTLGTLLPWWSWLGLVWLGVKVWRAGGLLRHDHHRVKTELQSSLEETGVTE